MFFGNNGCNGGCGGFDKGGNNCSCLILIMLLLCGCNGGDRDGDCCWTIILLLLIMSCCGCGGHHSLM